MKANPLALAPKSKRDVVIPVRLPPEWARDLTRKADKLGISRAAVFVLCVKIGAPILQKNINYLEQMVREACEE